MTKREAVSNLRTRMKDAYNKANFNVAIGNIDGYNTLCNYPVDIVERESFITDKAYEVLYLKKRNQEKAQELCAELGI
jgi:hypothetical protein